MTNLNLIILSYHKFVDEPSEYRFSRTYDQFYHDLQKKIFDLITIDDGMKCQIRACEILKNCNIRAKLFVCTSFVGKEGYCTWDELRYLSPFHNIEAHSDLHKDHTTMSYDKQYDSICESVYQIYGEIKIKPRFFVPPYNQFNNDTLRICQAQELQLITGRENILNISK